MAEAGQSPGRTVGYNPRAGQDKEKAPPFNAEQFVVPGEITVFEVQDMKRAFDMLDEDRSGWLDVSELKGAATALGVPMEENIDMIMQQEKVSFEEFFKRMTAKVTPDDTVDDLMNIFELFDVDCTGTISKDNLETVRNMIGAKEPMEQVMEMLSMVDTDGDGQIDPYDFYTCMVNGMRLRMDVEARKAREAIDAQTLQAAQMYGTEPERR